MVFLSRFQYSLGMLALSCIADTQAIEEKTSNLRSHRELGVYYTRTWPKGVACYDIPTPLSSERQQSLTEAMNQYREKIGIEFIPINECSAKYGSSSEVCGGCKVKFSVIQDGPGCNANLGYSKRGINSLNCAFTGVGAFLHGLGHILGRNYEHNHPDRKAILPVRGDNIETLDVDAYQKKTREEFSNGRITPYDYQSIMHYGKFCMPKDLSIKYCDIGETRDCVKPTKEDCDTSIRVGFDRKNPTVSEGDIRTFKEMYGIPVTGTDSTETQPKKKVTDKSSEKKVTDKSTEKVTDKSTEKVTDPEA